MYFNTNDIIYGIFVFVVLILWVIAFINYLGSENG